VTENFDTLENAKNILRHRVRNIQKYVETDKGLERLVEYEGDWYVRYADKENIIDPDSETFVSMKDVLQIVESLEASK
jgi:hypothetical protein